MPPGGAGPYKQGLLAATTDVVVILVPMQPATEERGEGAGTEVRGAASQVL